MDTLHHRRDFVKAISLAAPTALFTTPALADDPPKDEKKNNLWIKNLPKHYNTIEALSGFFKKYAHLFGMSA